MLAMSTPLFCSREGRMPLKTGVELACVGGPGRVDGSSVRVKWLQKRFRQLYIVAHVTFGKG